MRYVCRYGHIVSKNTYRKSHPFVKYYVKNINKYFVHLSRQIYRR